VLSVFDFSLKTIREAKKSRAIPAYFPSSASSLSRLHIQQALTYTVHLSNQVTLSICLCSEILSKTDKFHPSPEKLGMEVEFLPIPELFV